MQSVRKLLLSTLHLTGEKAESITLRLFGGADGSRTRDPLTASQVLIPTELQPL